MFVSERERIVHAARDLERIRRNVSPRLFAEIDDFIGHIVRRIEFVRIGIDQEFTGFDLGRAVRDLGKRHDVALFIPGAFAFLDDPESHDIFQKTNGIIQPALVGIACIHGLFAQNRLVEFHAEQRPGTAR